MLNEIGFFFFNRKGRKIFARDAKSSFALFAKFLVCFAVNLKDFIATP